MSIEPIIHKAGDMLDGMLFRLSLSGGFQPAGILRVENCQFAEYARYSDMYRADIVFSDQSPSMPIVAKAFRAIPNDYESIEQITNIVNMFQKHWLVVGYDHEYISPTWSASVATVEQTIPAIATPYYHNGNIVNYVRLHHSADRLDLICQAASAFEHIHSKDIVHGNICPENVCIADNGTVRVTDIAADNFVRQANTKNSVCVPSNWMYKSSEELECGNRTMETDIYSFAVTVYSVYTLKPPIPSRPHSYGKCLVQIINHGHGGMFGASKPAMMSDGLWEIVRICWTMDPSQRPSMSEVNGMLARMREES